jgi:hypothetical protein
MAKPKKGVVPPHLRKYLFKKKKKGGSGMAKKNKGKGTRRSKGKGHRRFGKPKPGLAESLGIAKSAIDVAVSPSPAGNALLAYDAKVLMHPSGYSASDWKYIMNANINAVKANAMPAVMGVVISNCDSIPFIGKLLAKPKRKIDRIAKRYTGFDL